MDACHVGLGLIIPEPLTQPPSLGDVIYIDSRGILRRITNMFLPSEYIAGETAMAINLPSSSQPVTREETVQRTWAAATDGIRIRRRNTEGY